MNEEWKKLLKENMDDDEPIEIADICPLDKFDGLKQAVKIDQGYEEPAQQEELNENKE